MTPAEATNKVIATVAITTTDTFVFIGAHTNDEYIGFTQQNDSQSIYLTVIII